MSSVSVAIVQIHGAFGKTSFLIKRIAPGKNWMGWAKFDGTFTVGLDPNSEAMEWGLVDAPYAEDAVEFAQAQGWNVISVIRR
jgi:hypothetical protein